MTDERDRYVWREIKIESKPVANSREVRALDWAITAALLLAAAAILLAAWWWLG